MVATMAEVDGEITNMAGDMGGIMGGVTGKVVLDEMVTRLRHTISNQY